VNAVADGGTAVRPNGEGTGATEECTTERERLVVEVTDDEPEEARRPRRMADPTKPSAREVEEHRLTHLPYRSWCWACVRGRGKNAAHTKLKEEKSVPEIHFDYMFVGMKDEPGEVLTCLVAREALSKMMLAMVVPSKSPSSFVVKRVLAFLDEVGCTHNDVTVKSDQEASINSLVDEIGRARGGGGKWMKEHSPVGASASNGVVERAIQSVQAQVRVLKLALEDKWKAEIPTQHAIMPWMVEYAAFLLNRFEVGHDGKTSYERLKGKTAKNVGVEFGEAVHWKVSQSGGALGKLSSSWRHGVFLGIRGKSGEIIVADGEGVWKTRAIQCKSQDERWDPKNAEMVITVPWAAKKEDGEIETDEKGKEVIPRRFYISTKNLEEHGYSSGCPG
jgi:hypothetical protein